MSFDSQTIIALGIVALAIGSLLRHWFGTGGQGSCGGCSGCASGSVASNDKPLDGRKVYQLDAPLKTQRRGSNR